MHWTFGRKMGVGFGLTVAIAMLMGLVAINALRVVVDSKDQVIADTSQRLLDVLGLQSSVVNRSNLLRTYLLTGEAPFIEKMNLARAQILTALRRIRSDGSGEETKRLVNEVEAADNDYQSASDRAVALRKGQTSVDAVNRAVDREIVPLLAAQDLKNQALMAHYNRLLENARGTSSATAASAISKVTGISVVMLLVAIMVGAALMRTLAGQLGSVVQHIRSSSMELQSTANQQVGGARDQAIAMGEVNTTITELLATSRQIAESAQRVAGIAERTASSAADGDETVHRAQESMGSIRRHVDLLVNHMLDLGKKSQQIGSILEITNELAEQTNILSINASIEAAGAGDAGRRFAVVADEIRKLADRMGDSTREIRALIEQVRAAVNTTAMATEGGAKAVESGARQFSELSAAFTQISSLVTTTTEAAREIGLSTKQQTSAVEQVNQAVASVAMASRETEANCQQTLRTATELSTLSRGLARIVHASDGA